MGAVALLFSALFGALLGAVSASLWGFGFLGIFIATEAAATVGAMTMALIIAVQDLRKVADRSREFVSQLEAAE